MRIYRVLTLQQVIDALRALPETAEVIGFDGVLHSYSASYDRSVTFPVPWPVRASELAEDMQKQVGKPSTGHKGGVHPVRADLPLHIADYGRTGPAVAGFERTDAPGEVYVPVGIEDTWF